MQPSAHDISTQATAETSHSLKNRHLQLMALGAAIGAGFFLGSGVAISQAGPALLIAYILAGAVIYIVIRALGELTLAHPSAGSFGAYATRFIGPLAGFVTGWSFWLAGLLIGVAEVTGIGLLMHHWFPGLPQWIPALCATAFLYAINMSTVRSFGELEYWLSMIKVVTIVGVLLCGLVILIFHTGPAGGQASISNLWTHGGFLPRGFSGLLTALPLVVFSFGGAEVLGLAAAETERTERSLPRAINGFFYRIMVFYVGSIAIIMMLYPWNLLDPKQSPFVLVLAHAGFRAAASLVTFVAISALLSSCNTGLYATSRMLRALAISGLAPARLGMLNKRKIPSLSLTVSGATLLLGVLLNYLLPDKIFVYLLTMVAWLLLWVWVAIVLSHLNYQRAASKAPGGRGSFRLPGAPYTNWAVLSVIGLVAILLAVNGGTRITFYILASWVGILIAAFYLRRSGQSARNA